MTAFAGSCKPSDSIGLSRSCHLPHRGTRLLSQSASHLWTLKLMAGYEAGRFVQFGALCILTGFSV